MQKKFARANFFSFHLIVASASDEGGNRMLDIV